ncbi:hypothetical protein JCM19238_4890 [Vibrio ponticus]|nr:hypothetical protein JCM19238_4890 [Vibrio ponticus]
MSTYHNHLDQVGDEFALLYGELNLFKYRVVTKTFGRLFTVT